MFVIFSGCYAVIGLPYTVPICLELQQLCSTPVVLLKRDCRPVCTRMQTVYHLHYMCPWVLQGRIIRFWGVEPDQPFIWQLMLDLGVDLVNTDNLKGLRDFIFERISTAGGAVAPEDMGQFASSATS